MIRTFLVRVNTAHVAWLRTGCGSCVSMGRHVKPDMVHVSMARLGGGVSGPGRQSRLQCCLMRSLTWTGEDRGRHLVCWLVAIGLGERHFQAASRSLWAAAAGYSTVQDLWTLGCQIYCCPTAARCCDMAAATLFSLHFLGPVVGTAGLLRLFSFHARLNLPAKGSPRTFSSSPGQAPA